MDKTSKFYGMTTDELFPGMKTYEKGKFAPKLTFADQCAWFIIRHRNGVSLRDIAEAAGISVHTASMLCSFDNKKYKAVKREYLLLGGLKMWDEYVQEHHIERVQKINETRRPPIPLGINIFHGHRFEVKKHEENKVVVFDLRLDLAVGIFETLEQVKEGCAEHIQAFYRDKV